MLTQTYGTFYQIESNSVGLQSSSDPEISYNRAWLNVLHCLLKIKLSLRYQQRGFSSHFGHKSGYHHIGVDFKPMHMTPFTDGFLFTPDNSNVPWQMAKVLFNLNIIYRLELIYEIAALYLWAYLLILSIIIPNCRGVIAEGWWNFSMFLNGLCFQVKPL